MTLRNKISLFILFLANSIAFAQPQQNIPTNGLVAWYPFNGNANDESGGNNGVVNGPILTSDRNGIANSAYTFDGIDDFILTQQAGPTGTGISISYWYKSDQSSQNNQVIAYGGNVWGTYMEIYHNHWSAETLGPCYGPAFSMGGTLISRGNNELPNSSQWHHVVAILPTGSTSLNSAIIYLDGNEMQSLCSYANYGAPSPNVGNANPIKFGQGWQTGSWATNFGGNLDDVAIYNLALGRAEVAQLFTSLFPSIAGFAPARGAIGTPVTITGTNFSTNPANNIVYFGATKATVTNATSTELTVTVPAGATYQPIAVTTNGLTAYSQKPFHVTFPSIQSISTASFASQVSLPLSGAPRRVAIGDLNGDGKADLAVANSGSGKLTLLENTSASGILNINSFSPALDLVSGAGSYGVAIGDLNGDGNPDLAVTNSGVVSVFENKGNAGSITNVSFYTHVDFSIGAGSLDDVAISDIDLDGKPDLIVSDGSSIFILRNQVAATAINTGSFASAVSFAAGGTLYRLAIGDLDNDLKPDIAVANIGLHKVSVFKNNSTPGSITISSLATKVDFTPGTNPENVSIGDMDGDSKPDLIVANSVSNTISVFRNTATQGVIDASSFAAKQDFGTGSIPYSAIVADLDGDGKLDMLATNRDGGTVSVLRNTATPGTIDINSFSSHTQFNVESQTVNAAIGDLDNDGKPDIVAVNFANNTLSILRNQISPPIPTISSFTPTSGSIGTSVTITGTNFSTIPTNNIVYFGATKATVTDATATQLSVTVPAGATYQPITVTVNGLTAYSSKPFIVTFLSSGIIDANSFAPKVDFTTGNNSYDADIADIDGDGKPDLVVPSADDNTVSVFMNTSSSGTITSSSFASKVDFTTGTTPNFVTIGDLDGDGKLDLVTSNRNSNTISIFRNTSSPGSIAASSFASKVDFTTGAWPYGASIGDVDGDGRPDLVVPNNGSNTVSVFMNTSTVGTVTANSFASKVDFITGTSPYIEAIGTLWDIDGDGKPELVITNYGSNTVSVFRNTSATGSITPSSFASKVDFTTGINPSGLCIGDVDGDGKPELVVANRSNATVSVLRNTSASGSITLSSFASKVDFTTGNDPWRVNIGDMDGDGKPELVVGNSLSGTVSIFKNTSINGSITTSSFAAKVDFTAGANPFQPAIGDVNGDGRADLVVPNNGSNTVSVFRNTIISEPTAQPTSLIFTNVQPTTMTLTWTAATGSPAGYIVLRKTVSSPTDIPIDGTEYTASNIIGTSTVAYVGSALTFNETGLTASTNYFYDVFSYNGTTGTYNYLTVSPLENNQTTNSSIATEPTAQPTVLTFSSVQPTSMTLTWTAATGSPTGYVILRKTVSSPTDVPIDGTAYTASNTIGTSTVAYVGSALTFNETGLIASTNYFYDVFSYNGTTGTYNYLTTSPLEGSKTTLATEPTAQPASLIFSSVQSTTMTLSWTAASSSPAGYLVLRNTVSSLTDVPVDATAYTTGNTIGTSTVAFAGSALTFNETSLAPLTNYFYNVFAYNGTTGTYNYLTISPLAGNQTTLAAEPTAQPTSLIFTNVQSTTMTLNWTAASGSPVGYIVLRNTVSSLTDIPLDATAYITGNTIGTSTVAYAGSALTFNETGLATSTNYFYNVFSYNGTTGTYNYLTLAPLVGTQTTLAAPPTAQPTALSFSNVQTTSITLTWIAATGPPTGYLVLRKTVSSPTDVPVDGTEYSATNLIGTSTVAYAASGITFIETGLIPSTNYFYDVFSYNGTTGTYNYLTTSPLENNQTTSPALASEPTAQPTSLIFTNVQPTTMTLSWTAATGSRAGYVVIRKTVSSPTDVPLDGTEYSATNTIGTSTVAYVGSALTFNETGLTASTTYFYDIFSYNGTTGTYNYLTASPLENNQTTSPVLSVEPSSQSSGLTFSSVQSTSMTLTWTGAIGSPTGYIVLRKTVSSPTDAPVDGTEYITGNAIGASTVAYVGSALTFNETGLTASTTYFYDVFSYNGSGSTINYLTALPLEGSKSTLATEPASQPTALVFSNVGSTTFTVSFTAATGTPSGYIVVRKAGSVATSLPVDATGYSSASAIGDGTIAYVGTAVTFNETGLTAGTNYFYQVYAYNGSGVTINYRTASPLTGNKSIDSTKPVIVHSPIAIVDKDVSLAITAQITDPESGVASASLFYKNRLTTSSEVILEMTLTGNNWVATIPASAIGEIGVEYWITALNGLGLAEQTPHYPVAVKQPSDGPPLPYDNFGSGQSNYRIISFPYQLDNKNAGNVFEELGQFDQFNWRLSHWNGTSTKELIATDPIETGWGYWLLVKNNPGKALTGGPGKSVSSPFSIQLKQGWNQIGNPYNFNIDWSDIQNANPIISAKALNVYTGTGTGTGYMDATVLRKMEGGFVNADQAFTLVFPATKSNARISSENKKQTNPFGTASWILALDLEKGEWINYTSGIGMRPDAKIGYDTYDDVSLPRMTEYIDLNHEKSINGNRLSKDIVPTSENHTWIFTVESNDKKEFASIKWDNSSFTENEKELFLIDENEKVSVNIRTLNSYSFKTPAKFKIIFGNKEYLSKEMPDGEGKILSVSPNPSHGETKITVSLPGWGSDYPVSIDLINSLFS